MKAVSGTDRLLVLTEIGDIGACFRIQSTVEQRFFHAAGKKVEKNADQLLRGDGAAVSRKADFHVDDKTAVGRIQNTGSTLQNFLPAAAYPKQTTFAGALCAERIRCDSARKLAQQVILEGDALFIRIIE